MLVECTREFLDKATRQTRKAGDRFDVDEERFSAINGTKYGQLVREVEDVAPDTAKRPRTRRRTSKRTAPKE